MSLERTMADIPVPQARYSLLIESNHRKGLFERNKWILFVLTSCLMVFTTLWLIFVHVNPEGLLYPQDTSTKRIPDHWLHRAIIYNTYDTNSVNYTLGLPKNQPETPPVTGYKLVCYYNFPTKVMPFRRLQAVNIEPDLCTHINIAFGSIRDNKIQLTDEQLAISQVIMGLKSNNTDLKILLSVGGAGNENGFPEMVSNHESRKIFIKSILNMVKEHRFDGVDLDWEFPEENVTPDGKQRMHFTQLLREIRNEINRQDKHKFLLTLAVAAPVFIVDNAYDVTYINDYVDFVNIMTYDYHFYTRLTPFTGINSPLYPSEDDQGYFATLNINYTVHYWMYKGMDREKMVVGLPTYGHSFRLVNMNNNGVKAPTNGYGSLGLNGFTGFNELCLFLQKNVIKPVFDMATKSSYATKNHEWISFDDVESLTYKAEFVRNHNFAGAMVYALNTDDHQGVCSENKSRFPLTRAIKEILDSKEL